MFQLWKSAIQVIQGLYDFTSLMQKGRVERRWPRVQENNNCSCVWNMSVWAVTCMHTSADKHHSRSGCVLLHQMSVLSGRKSCWLFVAKSWTAKQSSCQRRPNKTRQVASEHSLLVGCRSRFEWAPTLLPFLKTTAQIRMTPLHSHSGSKNKGNAVSLSEISLGKENLRHQTSHGQCDSQGVFLS